MDSTRTDWGSAFIDPPLSDRALDLLREVEAEFLITGAKTPGWDDPHADPTSEWGCRDAEEAEYSRFTDVGKYDIVHARARAWITVLLRRGAVRLNDEVQWAVDDDYQTYAESSVVLGGGAEGNPCLVIGFGRSGADYAGSVNIALGNPAVFLSRVPDCGCDACDSGSAGLLEEIDEMIFSVVDGSVEAKVRRSYSGYRTSFEAQGGTGGARVRRRIGHRAGPWFEDWTPRPLGDWA